MISKTLAKKGEHPLVRLLLELRLDETEGSIFPFVYYIDFLCLGVAENKEIMS